MRKKRRVPLVLWRLFRDRARTLATTITSLIPPHSPLPPPSCHCKGRLCLNCCGTAENAMSFLLQPRDPSDYRKLLNHCFVVVNDDAPPFFTTEFRPRSNWPQHEVHIHERHVFYVCCYLFILFSEMYFMFSDRGKDD